jgi:type II secretory ATPase GspE/PulE/Tfp pilus assembly ATPase PilB-like protein
MPKSPFEGILAPDKLKTASEEAAHSDCSIAAILIGKHNVPHDVIAKALAQFYRTEFIPYADERPVPPGDLLATLPYDYCVHHQCVPLSRDAARTVILMADPRDLTSCDDIARLLGGRVTFQVSTREAIRSFLDRFHKVAAPEAAHPTAGLPATVGAPDYALAPATASSFESDVDPASAAAMDGLVNQLLEELYRRKADEMRIAAAGDQVVVLLRFGIDWQPFTFLPGTVRRQVVQRLKIMAALDILQRRKPQCGRLRLAAAGTTREVLIATVPFDDGDEELYIKPA